MSVFKMCICRIYTQIIEVSKAIDLTRTPCRHIGCKERVSRGVGYCAKHNPKDDYRPNSNSRGYNARWQRARKLFLSEYPFCSRCDEAATVVDHIIPHRGDNTLFWDRDNWQSLCKRCHDVKTATEDGGFGRKNKK